MRFSFSNIIFNKGFLLADKTIYAIKKEGLQPVTEEMFRNTFLPVLFVGKEHCREFDKKYPITDIQDLKKILKMEFSELALVNKPEVTAQDSIVKAWQVDSYAADVINSKLLFWLPESWVLGHIAESALYKLQRADNNIWLCIHQGKSFSTVAKGLYSNASHFLMSVGVDNNASEIAIEESKYGSFFATQAELIQPAKLAGLFNAQGYFKKITRLCNWPSVALGAVLAITLFLALHIGYLQLRTNWLDQDINQQNVKELVVLQGQHETQSAALSSLEKSLYSNNHSANLWDVVATIMESGGTILRVKRDSEKFEIRVESKLATDILQIVGNISGVASVEFSTPVRKSLGKDRYTISVKWLENGEPNE